MYKPEHFNLFELVPKADFKHKSAWLLWILFDDRALITLDQLRKRYGKITVNDWYWSDDGAQFRGWRPSNCPIGATFSQHKFGRAFDCIFDAVESEEVRQDILKDPGLFPLINSIELGTPHLHFDTRNCERILAFNP